MRRLVRVVPMLDQRADRRITAVVDANSVATAQALDWPGVLFEAGRNDVVEVDDMVLGHHYVGLNADPRPITLEIKEQHGFRAVTLQPGQGWISPAGQPFSLRVRDAGPHAYVRFSIEPTRLDRLVNGDDAHPVSLRRTFDVGGLQVQHLLSALAAEARAGTPSGLAFVEMLTSALGVQIVRHAGTTDRREEPARGGLAPSVRRRILERMDAQTDTRLTIDELAGEAGLSPAHFARAFKESVGRAPHQHLVALRLDRARRLLEGSAPVLSQIAAATGFADQAHFTRFFKRRFGVTPGAFVRSRRAGFAATG